MGGGSGGRAGSAAGDLILPALKYLQRCCGILADMWKMPACPVFNGAHRLAWKWGECILFRKCRLFRKKECSMVQLAAESIFYFLVTSDLLVLEMMNE